MYRPQSETEMCAQVHVPPQLFERRGPRQTCHWQARPLSRTGRGLWPGWAIFAKRHNPSAPPVRNNIEEHRPRPPPPPLSGRGLRPKQSILVARDNSSAPQSPRTLHPPSPPEWEGHAAKTVRFDRTEPPLSAPACRRAAVATPKDDHFDRTFGSTIWPRGCDQNGPF